MKFEKPAMLFDFTYPNLDIPSQENYVPRKRKDGTLPKDPKEDFIIQQLTDVPDFKVQDWVLHSIVNVFGVKRLKFHL